MFKCQHESQNKSNINKWLSGELSAINIAEGIKPWVKRYLIDKYGNKCSKCGWCEVNPTTNKVPIQVEVTNCRNVKFKIKQ